MILRIWHGWTTPENADVYESLLKTTVFPRIEAKNVEGFRRIRLLRSDQEGAETEFITIMEFDSLEAVKRFAGEDYRQSYVPEEAQKVLVRYDAHSQHYEVTEDRHYD
ncbi:antibiotic biosynthesis monooxygenase [Marinobacter nanhaiticus D15-8W]|uniref:Antibiotic biosynthesis monooxygenase n=1 Tax=Marinobacter nanhaiticus D15-8W TaxID=626887 RepID=N6X5F2_9GAMM|nr:hypothetical protein [Marinobacter nanhaiticus]ENO16323.1 antibiotic biosynthesis monooxygenase [Marinobacter nanhaiticus D15-8W]BES72818.1 antibiotic biosynthesis monooxygenase [Marinobacter nanhaiticus D15-8W]